MIIPSSHLIHRQTGNQARSTAVPGKMQNCTEFGKYEPPGAGTETSKLCHGGHYQNETYLPCPVKEECRERLRREKGMVYGSTAATATTPARYAAPGTVTLQPFPTLRPPNYSTLPTRLPQTGEQVKAALNAAVDTAQKVVDAQMPRAVVPPKDAPLGLRTPFAAQLHYIGEMSPTFLPLDGEDILERLMKNIVQGMISAIGWHVYSYTRTVDLFS